MSLRTESGPDGFVPFPADRAARYRSAGYWTGQTLYSILSEAARRWPDRAAVLDADTALGSSQRLSFAQLDERADRAAAGLAELGIAAGDRVLLQLPNSCEFAVALFALLRAGDMDRIFRRPLPSRPGVNSPSLPASARISA